jgi:hypothetical protein
MASISTFGSFGFGADDLVVGIHIGPREGEFREGMILRR